jgi:uncharacterized protein
VDDKLSVILRELNEGLASLYGDRLERLVLYGSQARGEARSDSDIDVLIVLRGTLLVGEEIRRTVPITAEISLRHNVFISCAYASVDRYEHDDEPLLINVRREGVRI